MESSICILDLPNYYKVLRSFVQNDDISGFMTGENIPFPAVIIKKDDLWIALTLPSSLDPLVEQMLQACFKSIGLLERVLDDLHPSITNTFSKKQYSM